ncbi:MAG: integration host factor subunit alpha [uncultured bacterium]|nr:MAG: integration host factor subunit alpha [uncultured bacterium]HLD44720.1 integration host factor subunit alpha [bacterium]
MTDNVLSPEGDKTKTLTKAELIESIYEKVGFSKKEASDIVELVFETLKATLEKGEKVKISGFGNFVVRQKRPRIGRNPQTGQEIEISSRRVLTFKPSQVLKTSLNK